MQQATRILSFVLLCIVQCSGAQATTTTAVGKKNQKKCTHGGDRTRDHAVKSRALCRLSYMDSLYEAIIINISNHIIDLFIVLWIINNSNDERRSIPSSQVILIVKELVRFMLHLQYTRLRVFLCMLLSTRHGKNRRMIIFLLFSIQYLIHICYYVVPR